MNLLPFLIRLAAGAILGSLLGLILIPPLVRKTVELKNRKHKKPTRLGLMTGRISRLVSALTDAVLTALSVILLPPVPAGFAVVIFQIVIVCVFVDFYIRLIANEAVVALLVLGVGYRIAAGGPASLLGSLGALGLVLALFVVCALLMMARRGTAGVGAGDFKYALVLAVAVGWDNILYFLGGLAAALLIYCLYGVWRRKLDLSSYFPMCLHLSVGAAAALLGPGLLTFLSQIF